MWKVSREFQETLQAYKQPTTQELDGDQPTNVTYQHFENDHYTTTPKRQSNHSNDINMARQQETVSIGFDPSQYSQTRKSIERPAPTYTWEVQNGVAQSSSNNNNTTTNYRSTLNDDNMNQKSQTKEPTVTEFYAPQQPEYEDGGLYAIAPGEEEASAAGVHTNWDTQSFERPRAVPYDHRETRLVVKEDIDFFMALLGGQDPPPATEATQHFIQEETAARRQSEEILEREVEERRSEELVTTQTDLEFWNMLMKA